MLEGEKMRSYRVVINSGKRRTLHQLQDYANLIRPLLKNNDVKQFICSIGGTLTMNSSRVATTIVKNNARSFTIEFRKELSNYDWAECLGFLLLYFGYFEENSKWIELPKDEDFHLTSFAHLTAEYTVASYEAEDFAHLLLLPVDDMNLIFLGKRTIEEQAKISDVHPNEIEEWENFLQRQNPQSFKISL